MKAQAISLNLSRKWRSQTFDQIVGQDLSVRILKNSLYSNQFFPVYLFLGQRGCGKTSTARVFAAALNCQKLAEFQANPRTLLPCLTCSSCVAMSSGNHPDFIEIDAASHTGVDHMRTIIESSTLLPIMGRKRVYLIDEAHMLSKAAFNAALKILEEPPATALFILATTNPQKIIDTVRSRCFQLFFSPIAHDPLKNHLHYICKEEAIVYDDEALDVIIRHTQGSARDALNTLEQVRFAHEKVTKEAVLQLLGHINDQHIIHIIKIVLRKSASELLTTMQTLMMEHYAADFLWQRLMTLLRALLWIKHGLNPTFLVASDDITLHDVARECSLSDLHAIIEALYENEELFLKTPMQHALLEMILLQLCRDKKRSDNNGGSAPSSVTAVVTLESDENDEEIKTDEENDDDSIEETKQDSQMLWKRFVEQIPTLQQPILISLFQQSTLHSYDEVNKKIIVICAKDRILFKEWLDNTRTTWQPLLRTLFSADVVLEVRFEGATNSTVNKSKPAHTVESVAHKSVAVNVAPKEKIVVAKQREYSNSHYGNGQKVYQKNNAPKYSNEKIIDVSDEHTWKIASMLVRHFPGVVTEIRENR